MRTVTIDEVGQILYPTDQKTKIDHQKRVADDLKRLGVSRLWRYSSECTYLPKLIHYDESIDAVVHGRFQDGAALMVATDRRLIFLDKKPIFVRADEMSYDLIGGITYGQMGLFATITLHSRIGDYKLRTMNKKCALHFRDYIESRCLEHRDYNSLPAMQNY